MTDCQFTLPYRFQRLSGAHYVFPSWSVMFGKLGGLLLDDTSLAAAKFVNSDARIIQVKRSFAPITFHAHPITGPKKLMKHHLFCPEGELFPDISRESLLVYESNIMA